MRNLLAARLAAPVLVSLMLAGCGFHLRGGAVLPPEIGGVHVDAPFYLGQELRIFLESAGTALVANRAQADVVLWVREEPFEERVLSVDPNTGKEREFEIAYIVDFRLSRKGGETLVEQQEIRLLRDYVFDPDAIIGKSRERGVLYEEMRRDAAEQISRRLRASLQS